MVADQPSFAEAYREFAEFVAGSVLMAHNARFDIAFINAEARRNLLAPPPNQVIDSLALFRRWFPDAGKYSLEALSQYLKIEDKEFHRAVADSMCIFWILELGLDRQDFPHTLGTMEKDAGGAMRF
jgi:DNA polymerase-3 subunit alpha (Gram-positive type)